MELKNHLKKVIIILGAVICASVFAAQKTTNNHLSKLLDSLNQQGYHTITEVERDGNVIKIEGVHKDGVRFKFSVNQNTGAIISQKPDPMPHLTVSQVAKQLETKGYHQINEIELKPGKYEVKAIAPNGKKQKIYVDCHTGAIQNND